MNKHTDWQAEHDEPPTAEEMLAYSLGELPAEEAARIKERLQQFPELARIYTTPFPEAGAEPGDPHHLPEETIDRRWKAFEKDVIGAERGGRVLWFPRFFRAAAAVLIVLLGGLLLQSRATVNELRAELERPRVLQEVALPEEGSFRGRGPTKPSLPGRNLQVQLMLTSRDEFDDYRATLHRIEGTSRRMVAEERGLKRSETTDNFAVSFYRIEPGEYEIVLHGIKGAESTRLATYAFNVAR